MVDKYGNILSTKQEEKSEISWRDLRGLTWLLYDDSQTEDFKVATACA